MNFFGFLAWSVAGVCFALSVFYALVCLARFLL